MDGSETCADTTPDIYGTQVSYCPKGEYFIYTDDTDQECKACDENCLECIGSSTQCLQCNQGMILNQSKVCVCAPGHGTWPESIGATQCAKCPDFSYSCVWTADDPDADPIEIKYKVESIVCFEGYASFTVDGETYCREAPFVHTCNELSESYFFDPITF
jgi:hypothetical protein